MWKPGLLGLIIAVALGLGSTVLRNPIAEAASPFTNVIVGNSSSNPVPVAEQNVDANGDLKVHEEGTAAVADVNSPAHTPVTAAADAVAVPDSNNTCTATPNFYTVPTGKTLVIQFVSADTLVAQGQSPLFILNVGGAQYPLPVVAGASANGLTDFRWMEPLTIYAAAGTDLSTFYSGSEFGGCSITSTGHLTINGYLIDA